MSRYRPSRANPARTGIQLVPSAAITEFIDAFVYDMTDRQYGSLGAILLILFSYGQNLWEEKKGQALFKPDPNS